MKKLLLAVLTMLILFVFASCETEDTPTECQHNIVTDPAIVATCTETGLTEGSHCSLCNEVMVQQEIIEARGHAVKVDNAISPTCTQTGITEGKYCSFCGEVFIAQNTIEALGHTIIEIPAISPTCTTTGLTMGTKCSTCNEILTHRVEVECLGHTEETIFAVAATCTTNGKTEGKKCSVCGKILVAQQTVTASHKWDNGTITIQPTCTDKGIKIFNCTNCDEQKTEEVAATGHSETNWIRDKTESCTETGNRHKECTVCQITTKSEITPATGHSASNKIQCDTCNMYVVTINEINYAYTDNNGLTVTLNSFIVKEYDEYFEYVINYTVKNKVLSSLTDGELMPGTFKLFLTDGTSKRQYGIFTSLRYDASSTRSYTWQVPKNQNILILEYNADDTPKSDNPTADSMHWLLPVE